MSTTPSFDPEQLATLAQSIKNWARELGFADLRIADIDLREAEIGLQAWLAAGLHGEMDYMAAHGVKRSRPAQLIPGTVRVLCARMNYLPRATPDDWREREEARLLESGAAVISIYGRGRDYHKVMRGRLQQLATRIDQHLQTLAQPAHAYRVFADSAPVMEVALGDKAGLGWRGKHTLLLNRDAGSLFFLGEIFTNLPLPIDAPISAHCGSCQACIDVCPTQAITAPYRLDARRCISYLTLELKGSIPLDLRRLIGNRIAGCDDCQLVCPWNKFAQRSVLADFDVRHGFDQVTLIELFEWDQATFERNTEGSALRRIGFERWLRNLAVALGNGLRESDDVELQRQIKAALQTRIGDASALVREHVQWALEICT